MIYKLPINVQMLLRPSGNKTMIVAVCNDDLKLPERGEVVVGSILIMPQARFDPGERFRNLRADQILCSSAMAKDMKRLDNEQ